MQVRGNPFLLAGPDGPRDRQLLTGDAVDILARRGGWAQVASRKDGYCGWLAEAALLPPAPSTHRVCVRTSWLYPAPTVRDPPLHDLHFGARLRVLATEGAWCRVASGGVEGFLPARHLQPAASTEPDPVAVARLFLGTPYLWAGNTGFGIDCSGLVQAALLACGIACPGDSDQQERALGRPLAADADWRAGDLVFWKGHVALVADPETLIHASGHAMQVCHEAIAAALARIRAAGEPVSSRRRL